LIPIRYSIVGVTSDNAPIASISAFRPTYTNGTGFSDGDEPTAAAVKLLFNDPNQPLDIANTDTLTISFDGDSIDVFLPTIAAPVTYYLDEKGNLFTDSALTTMASPRAGITDESITAAETDVDPVYTGETLTMSETTREEDENYGEEELSVTETFFRQGRDAYKNENLKIKESGKFWISEGEETDDPSGSGTEVNNP